MSEMSKVYIKRINGLVKHSNADNLLIGESDGCPFIVNKNFTQNGDLRIIVNYDMICPNAEWVSEEFRGKKVKPCKLRGVFSMAVCLPLPPGDFTEEEDVTDRLGFIKWEPKENLEDGVQLENGYDGSRENGPSIMVPKYDVESLRKYHHNFQDNEVVLVQEKLDGENFAAVYWDDRFWVRSRNWWKKDGENKWWETFRKYNWDYLKKNPGFVVFGEKYGNVKGFRYDCKDGEQKIAAFDVWDANKGEYLSVPDMNLFLSKVIGLAPVIDRMVWPGLEGCKNLAKGQSRLGGNIMEGIVVRPIQERKDYRFNRVIYKLHSEEYLIKKGKSA